MWHRQCAAILLLGKTGYDCYKPGPLAKKDCGSL